MEIVDKGNGGMEKNISVDKKASSIKENAPPVVVATQQPKEDTNVAVNDNSSQVVYITRTGSKYHRDGCSYLKSRIPSTVGDTKRMGLGACSRCNPPG